MTASRAARYLKARIPRRLRSVLRSMQALADGRPALGLPPIRRVLAIAPHPDDESLGCGGTLALLAASGAEITVVVVSDGEALEGTGLSRADIAGRRREEAEAACRVLGVGSPRFLALPDDGLARAVDRLAAGLAEMIAEAQPVAIFVPWFLDGHDDHRAVSVALSACSLQNSVEVWGYEVWTPLPANRLVDISEVWETKKAAIDAHTSDPLLNREGMLGLNRYRAAQALIGGSHAEAFLAAPAGRYFSLMREVEGL